MGCTKLTTPPKHLKRKIMMFRNDKTEYTEQNILENNESVMKDIIPQIQTSITDVKIQPKEVVSPAK